MRWGAPHRRQQRAQDDSSGTQECGKSSLAMLRTISSIGVPPVRLAGASELLLVTNRLLEPRSSARFPRKRTRAPLPQKNSSTVVRGSSVSTVVPPLRIGGSRQTAHRRRRRKVLQSHYVSPVVTLERSESAKSQKMVHRNTPIGKVQPLGLPWRSHITPCDQYPGAAPLLRRKVPHRSH